MSASVARQSDNESDPRGGALTLSVALRALRAAVEQGSDPTTALDACHRAERDSRRAHVQYCEIGELAMGCERYEEAERFVVKSLIASPKYGAAFKLLGRIASAAGRPDDAAICYRYGLPASIERRYFRDAPCVYVDSADAVDAGIERRSAYPSERHRLKPPRQLETRYIVELDHEVLNAAEGYLGIVPDGRLWFDSFNSITWDRQGRIVRDLCRGYSQVVQMSVGSREPLALPGTICLLGNRNAVNYYHWMNDVLPRLAVLQAAGIDLESIDRFVVTPLKHDFHRESLTRFGIHEDRLHSIRRGEFVTAEQVLVPIFGSNALGMAQGAWTSAFLKRSFAPSLPGAPSRRLYISRGHTGARGVSNEQRLLESLLPRGFEKVTCEAMTISEQAALFASASVILGPHGAGLTNIAHCQPGTVVIELFNAHMAPCFWTTSELTGLTHAVHFCGAYDEDSRPSDHEQYHQSADDRRRSAFPVNVDEVMQVLDMLGVR